MGGVIPREDGAGRGGGMVVHFLYPSGLTATSPKIGEDGRRYLGRMVRAKEGKMVVHFLYPSGLTATSPKIGEDWKAILREDGAAKGRGGWFDILYTPPSLRDTSPRGGGSDALGGWCGVQWRREDG